MTGEPPETDDVNAVGGSLPPLRRLLPWADGRRSCRPV